MYSTLLAKNRRLNRDQDFISDQITILSTIRGRGDLTCGEEIDILRLEYVILKYGLSNSRGEEPQDALARLLGRSRNTVHQVIKA